MAIEKRTLIIIIIVIILVIGGATIVFAVGLKPRESFVHLEVIPEDDSGSNMIHVKHYDRRSVNKWKKIIDGSLTEYRMRNSTANRVTCNRNNGALSGQVCDVPIDTFHPCTSENNYSYDNGSPCVFLKLNKMINWIPEPYNSTEDLPDNMPSDLVQHIKFYGHHTNSVWVSCDGEDYADRDNIGPFQYIPRRGFPSYYFPYTGQDGYLSPLIALYLERPREGVLIKVECKVWAKNIIYNHDERRGSVVFNIMVE